MLANRKPLLIVNLGDIVTPDFSLMIIKFSAMLTAKKPNSTIKDNNAAMIGVIKQTTNAVNQFKLGQISEEHFNQLMLSELEQATGVRLTVEAFDEAWHSMNPHYSQFESKLTMLRLHHHGNGENVVLISFTNPKDMRFLAAQLKQHEVPHQLENGELIAIDGIKLVTTYLQQKTKAELIEGIIKQHQRKSLTQSPLASSMNAVVGAPHVEATPVRYIRGVNNINDPVLKAVAEQTNTDVDNAAKVLKVNAIIWNKETHSLQEILTTKDQATIKLAAGNL